MNTYDTMESSEGSNGSLSPLVDSSPSEYSSSSSTPTQKHRECIMGPSKEELKIEETVNEKIEEAHSDTVLGSPIKLITKTYLAVVPTSNPYAKGLPTRRVEIQSYRRRLLGEPLPHIAANRAELLRSILSIQLAYASALTDATSAVHIAEMVIREASSLNRRVPISQSTKPSAATGTPTIRRFPMPYKPRLQSGLRPLLLPMHISKRQAKEQKLCL